MTAKKNNRSYSTFFKEYQQPLLLCCAYGLSFTGIPLTVFSGGLIGNALTHGSYYSTLPAAIMVIGLVCGTVPASLIMRRLGRKVGFCLGLCLSSGGALLVSYAVVAGNFWLVCCGIFFLGWNNTFLQQYRFAAAESVRPEKSSIAISILLIGGIAAGFIGPELASSLRNLFGDNLFGGAYFIYACVNTLAIPFVLLFNSSTQQSEQQNKGKARSLLEIAKLPQFQVALFSAMIGYGIMSFVMNATSISMNVLHGFSTAATAGVIQAHVLGMYVPSIFTGKIIQKVGAIRVIIAGVGVNALAMATGLSGENLWQYTLALILLGVGWNFMFIGGTSYLTGVYRPSEKLKTQACNDFLVFAFQGLGSLASGSVLLWLGWNSLLLITLPIIAFMAFLIFIHRKDILKHAKG